MIDYNHDYQPDSWFITTTFYVTHHTSKGKPEAQN
jgi:hypothetical protein